MADNRINLPFALSSSTPSWWDFHHHATLPSTSSWTNTTASAVNFWENQNNSNSSPCDQEDVSITASNHSSLTVDECSHRFVQPSSSYNNIIGEPAAGNNIHPWIHLLLAVGEGQEMPEDMNDEVGEINLLDALSLKSFSGGMFEPSACSDYLKKFDTGFPNQNLTYQPELFDHMGYTVGNSSFNGASYSFNHKQPGNYHHEEIDQDSSSCQTTLFPKSFIDNSEYGYRPIGGNLRPNDSSMHYLNGFSPSVIDPFSHPRSQLSSKPLLKSLSLLDSKKNHGNLSKPLINKGNGRGQGASSTNEAKKKKLDDTSGSSGSLKKPKHESSSSNPSTASSCAKMTNSQAQKVKIAAEKISALHQIVSPCGKTDTASVLQEAIGFIKCLQEQVQLLSNRYLKSSVNKLQEGWGSLDKKIDKGKKPKVYDLKSKGLCLVPTSSIPPVYKDSSGHDYWPTYRGCLYR